MSRTAIVIVLALVIGAGSYLATRNLGFAQIGPAGRAASQPAAGPLASYLNLSDQRAEEVRQADPDFATEAAKLDADLGAEQETLAALLETPDSTNDAIMAQVEKVMLAHNALERRAAEHVLKIRPHLTAEQQKRLMGLAAKGVREACRRRGDESHE